MTQQLSASAAAAIGISQAQLRQEWPGHTLADVAGAHHVDPATVAEALKADVDRQAEQMAAQRGNVSEARLDAFEQQLGQAVDQLMTQPAPSSLATGVAATPAAANCSATSTGFTPLPDLGSGTYHGFAGGLYPDGSNQPPDDYQQLGLSMSRQVEPRAPDGRPDPAGQIVLLSLGMSNATLEFSAFRQLANADPQKNPRLTMVDGAQGGADAEIVAQPDNSYWTTVNGRLRAAGATADQVQVIWLKEAIADEQRPFPQDAQRLQQDLATIVQIARQRFPNLKLVFVSSRTYAGYATSPLNPEPYAYESGFAVKWLVQERIDAGAATEAGPWIGWGPYLWTDGTRGRSDGFVWTCQDVGPDGTHPSDSGRRKVADLLLRFFTSDSETRSWFAPGT